jgi:Sigma-70, region 4
MTGRWSAAGEHVALHSIVRWTIAPVDHDFLDVVLGAELSACLTDAEEHHHEADEANNRAARGRRSVHRRGALSLRAPRRSRGPRASRRHPVGYLYRVGRTSAVRSEARDVPVAEPAPAVAWPDDSFEPGLAPAIACLSKAQRCAVVLVVGFGYTLREAAEVLGVTASTVHRDCERALTRLRSELEVENAH